jgi:1-phosphatidylinositol phosphodiesterase
MRITSRSSLIIVAGILAGLAVATPAAALPSDNRGYSSSSGAQQTLTQWMSALPDSAALGSLSIPGTHDSLSDGPGGVLAQTQSMTLSDQLTSGIRFVDLRFAKRSGSDQLWANHGIQYLGKTIDDVLPVVSAFLRDHPSETLIMRVKQEDSKAPDEEFGRALSAKLAPYVSQLFAPESGLTPSTTLGQLRGKLVVLPAVAMHIAYTAGDPGRMGYRQDQYNLRNFTDLYGKWTAVRDFLAATQTRVSGGDTSLNINYLSGSNDAGRVYPYFVASGQTTIGTNAGELSTALCGPAFSGRYPDFDRANGCIYYTGTNKLAASYIARSTTPDQHWGIVVADFPGRTLIDAVVNANRPQPGPSQSFTITGVASGRCVDNLDLSTAPGNAVALWDCNGGANQSWTLDRSRLVVQGQCLVGAGAGVQVGIRPCADDADLNWDLGSGGIIRHRLTGLCLDANREGTANRTPVILWTCGSGANARWVVNPS